MAESIFCACSCSCFGIIPVSMLKLMHSSICSEAPQYASHSSGPLQAGGFIPRLIAAKTLCASSCFPLSIIPASMLKLIHSSMCAEEEQYLLHSVGPLQAGGFMPRLIAAKTFSDSSSWSCDIIPFFWAKVIHSSMCEELLQYLSHSACPLQLPGPIIPLSLNFLALANSSGVIKLSCSAKAKQASEFLGASQNTLQLLSLLQLPSSGIGYCISPGVVV